MKPSEIMRQAMTELSTRGFYKGNFEGPTGAVCGHGAIMAALGYLDQRKWKNKGDDELFERMADALSQESPLLFLKPGMKGPREPRDTEERSQAHRHFPWYNDMPQTTMSEVLGKMENAVVALEARGE